LLQQALDALRWVSSDEEVQERAMRRVLRATSDLEFQESPPRMGREIHRIIREETGSRDPYAEIKRRSTEVARSLEGDIRLRIRCAEDPFDAAVRFAIAGNVMDFALARRWDGPRILQSFEGALRRDLAHSDVEDLRREAEGADRILFIGDNAGEVVLDRLLIEQMEPGKVTYAVKGGPIINDAVREDAVAAGIGEVAAVVDTGSDAPGVFLDEGAPEFLRLFRSVDLVIAKGQANLETLCDCGREVFFLAQMKCPVIARDMGMEIGDWVCKRGGIRS
jgi:uncharacterized protein with ATP-grasp and redox domains